MDNDELEELFSSVDENANEETKSDLDEKEEVIEASSVDEPESDVEGFSMEDFSEPSKEDLKEIERKKKQQKKIDARKETIKDIEEFEALLEKKRLAAKKAREEKREYNREHYVPLKDRKFLEDFPLSFGSTVAILVSLIIVVIAFNVMFNPALRLVNYSIEGNHQVSDERVIELIGLNDGDHLLRSYLGIENRIKRTTPYIKDINISFEFPSTLNVKIAEREKIAYVQTTDGYAAIDKDGIVLEFSSDYTEAVHPLLCGIEINSVVIGEDIGITDNLSYQKMIVILGAVLSAEQNSIYDSDYSFFENLKEVRILPSGFIFLTVELPNESLLTVKLNDITTIDDKMHWLMYAIEEGGMDKLPAGSLDMTEDSPIYHQYETYG